MRKALLGISFILLFISCGKDTSFPGQRTEKVLFVSPAETEEYSYEFTKRGCSTGVQTFPTFYDACEGLKNEVLNDGCAYDDRKELFETSYCPGVFEE